MLSQGAGCIWSLAYDVALLVQHISEGLQPCMVEAQQPFHPITFSSDWLAERMYVSINQHKEVACFMSPLGYVLHILQI